jgi:hypothetical protein
VSSTHSKAIETFVVRGSTPISNGSDSPIANWEIGISSSDGEREHQFFVDSFKFRVSRLDVASDGRLELDRLKELLNLIAKQVQPELTKELNRFERAAAKASRNGLDYVPLQPWIEKLPPIHRRLAILRVEHERRVNSGQVVEKEQEKSFKSIGAVSSETGVSSEDILELETLGLLRPARSEGGQRRYSRADVERIVALTTRPYPAGRSSSIDSDTGAMAAMAPLPQPPTVRDTSRSQMSAAEVKAMTVATVAQLYLEACDRYPNRDHSVIEYIREHMEWLSRDYIVTMIRLARKWGISLPVYRRGRLPSRGLAASIERSLD